MEEDNLISASQETKSDTDGTQDLNEDEVETNAAIPYGNCAERIIFVIDTSFQLGISSHQQVGVLKNNWDLVKRAIIMFIITKASHNSNHQFAISVLKEKSVLWLQDMTSNIQLILDCLNDIQCLTDSHDLPEKCSLGSVFKEIFNCNVVKSCRDGGGDYVVRVIFIYGRNCTLVLSRPEILEYNEVISCSRFFFDVLCVLSNPDYLTEFKENIANLCRLEGSNYVVEAFRNPAHVFESMAILLAHPLQRCSQNQCHYSLDPE